MGATYVDVTIRNPADRRRNWTGKFLVDTGAFDSLVPRGRLEEIGLQPVGQRDYVLADGKSIALDITVAEIEFEGEIVGGTVVYGEEAAEPLLGVTALESGGFEVDPRNEELKRLPAVLLKKLVPRDEGFSACLKSDQPCFVSCSPCRQLLELTNSHTRFALKYRHDANIGAPTVPASRRSSGPVFSPRRGPRFLRCRTRAHNLASPRRRVPAKA